jgi:hypothetical protein
VGVGDSDSGASVSVGGDGVSASVGDGEAGVSVGGTDGDTGSDEGGVSVGVDAGEPGELNVTLGTGGIEAESGNDAGRVGLEISEPEVPPAPEEPVEPPPRQEPAAAAAATGSGKAAAGAAVAEEAAVRTGAAAERQARRQASIDPALTRDGGTRVLALGKEEDRFRALVSLVTDCSAYDGLDEFIDDRRIALVPLGDVLDGRFAAWLYAMLLVNPAGRAEAVRTASEDAVLGAVLEREGIGLDRVLAWQVAASGLTEVFVLEDGDASTRAAAVAPWIRAFAPWLRPVLWPAHCPPVDPVLTASIGPAEGLEPPVAEPQPMPLPLTVESEPPLRVVVPAATKTKDDATQAATPASGAAPDPLVETSEVDESVPAMAPAAENDPRPAREAAAGKDLEAPPQELPRPLTGNGAEEPLDVASVPPAAAEEQMVVPLTAAPRGLSERLRGKSQASTSQEDAPARPGVPDMTRAAADLGQLLDQVASVDAQLLRLDASIAPGVVDVAAAATAGSAADGLVLSTHALAEATTRAEAMAPGPDDGRDILTASVGPQETAESTDAAAREERLAAACAEFIGSLVKDLEGLTARLGASEDMYLVPIQGCVPEPAHGAAVSRMRSLLIEDARVRTKLAASGYAPADLVGGSIDDAGRLSIFVLH